MSINKLFKNMRNSTQEENELYEKMLKKFSIPLDFNIFDYNLKNEKNKKDIQ